MANKKAKPTKALTAIDRLTDTVKQEFHEIPTPGQIKAWLKEAKHKRIDQQTARNIQMRLKRASKKEVMPAAVVSTVTETKPAGQMRRSTSHGNW